MPGCLGLLGLLAVAALRPALAGQTVPGPACFSPPPRAWTTADHGRLSARQRERLQALLREQQGWWTGRMTEMRCLGSRQAPQREIRRYRVQAQMQEPSSDLFELEAELEAVDRATVRRQWLWWLPTGDRLRFGDEKAFIPDDPRWDVDVIEMDRDGLIFRRRYRVRTGPGRSVSRLDVRSLHGGAGALTLEAAFYTQGVLAGRRIWHLCREGSAAAAGAVRPGRSPIPVDLPQAAGP